MSFYGKVECPRGEEEILPHDEAHKAYDDVMKEVNKEFKASGEAKYVIEDTKDK